MPMSKQNRIKYKQDNQMRKLLILKANVQRWTGGVIQDGKYTGSVIMFLKRRIV